MNTRDDDTTTQQHDTTGGASKTGAEENHEDLTTPEVKSQNQTPESGSGKQPDALDLSSTPQTNEQHDDDEKKVTLDQLQQQGAVITLIKTHPDNNGEKEMMT